jgi:hypothetical protein
MAKRGLVLLVVLLGGCGRGGTATVPPPKVAVYSDRFEFRGETYATVSALRVALTAARADAVSVDVRECIERERLVQLVGLLREHSRSAVEIALPQGC